MARLMFSWGMFSAFAARIAVRSRGFPSGSPPLLAAMVISLMMRVNVLPRLASSAPFLCLIVAHFEWPDMRTSAVREMPAQHAPDLVSITPAALPQIRPIAIFACPCGCGADESLEIQKAAISTLQSCYP